MEKSLNLDVHLVEAEKRINEVVANFVGDYLYRELVTVIEKDLLRPLIQAGFAQNLSHLELFLQGEQLLTIPLGKDVTTDRSNPAATVVVGSSPLEVVQKTARRMMQIREKSLTKPTFNLYAVPRE